MRKVTQHQIEADGRLIQKISALQEYIKNTQRYLEEKRLSIKAELDNLLTHINGEFDVMNAMHREISAELTGVIEKKPEEKPEAADDQANSTVTSLQSKRK